MANENRLIDANVFKGKLIRELNKTGKYTPYECGLDDAISYLDNAPTVDAVEVVHGRWVATPVRKLNSKGNVFKYCDCYHCSECGTDRPIVPPYNYCPNCGTKMDGELR